MRGSSERGDERVEDCGGVDEVVDSRRGGGPNFVGWDWGWREGGAVCFFGVERCGGWKEIEGRVCAD